MSGKVSVRCFELIKFFEGCYLEAYQDSNGIWTIGIGHTDGVYPGQKITEEQALDFLDQDLEIAKTQVDTINMEFTQCEYDILVSFTFNAGFAWINSETGKLLLSGDKLGFINRFLLYHRDNTSPLLGLYRRRLAERALFLYGVNHYYQEIYSIPSDVINDIPKPDPPYDEYPSLPS